MSCFLYNIELTVSEETRTTAYSFEAFIRPNVTQRDQLIALLLIPGHKTFPHRRSTRASKP